MFAQLKNYIKKHGLLFENFSYITVMQIFLLAIPLITYPYLVRVLGTELYGLVITAQILASYGSIVVDFGFKSVTARHIAIHRNNNEKLSEILSSVLTARFALWIISFIIYLTIVLLASKYRIHLKLFLFAFTLTFNELLYPQFFFQGIERMKVITYISITIRLIFLFLIFLLIKKPSDYIYVPLYLGIGYFIGGLISLYVIRYKYKIKYVVPSFSNIKYYLKDASPIFFTDIICTIKDKLNYLIIGHFIGMSQVVIYDLGAKFTSILTKPAGIIGTVLFPRIANTRDKKLFKKGAIIILLGTFIMVLIFNIFLPQIVYFFLNEKVDLVPLRVFLLAPIIVSLSGFMASNFLIAFGKNRYILYSIILTTLFYCIGMLVIYYNNMNTLLFIIIVSVASYLVELLYRLFIVLKNYNHVKTN